MYSHLPILNVYIKATFGGIFGLCVGGSILSLIEMVYFFTFRLYGQTIQQHSPIETVTTLSTSIDNDTKSNDDKSTLHQTIIKSKSIVIISQDNMTQYGYFNWKLLCVKFWQPFICTLCNTFTFIYWKHNYYAWDF